MTALRITPVLWLLLLMPGAGARAQLISPGRLSTAHESLEGLRACTNCHALGRKGTSSAKCLECHTPVKTRLDRGHGFHASVTGECADCHKEHFGRDFDVMQLDTTSFDHSRTGYQLNGSHAETSCRECHYTQNIVAADVREWVKSHETGGRTMLGLGRTCFGCHTGDDAHGGQFPQSCDDCHDSRDWSRATGFDHDRTSYRLTGRHRDAECEGCHRRERSGSTSFVRYRGIVASECLTCHRDPHDGVMAGGCTTCHDTRGWANVDRDRVADRFDHSRTRFELRDQHAAADCTACHSRSARIPGIRLRFGRGPANATYPRPASDGCASCHLDHHEDVFAQSPGGTACDGCHDERGWQPVSFDIERHNRTSSFELTGAHISTPCTACHEPEAGGGSARFHFEERECETCHVADSPHGERYVDTACVTCHVTESFEVSDFDHDAASGETCVSCHEVDDPHDDQFAGSDCQACHGTDSFRIEEFDHSNARYRLDGEHIRVRCDACHVAKRVVGREIVIYRPLPFECEACHGGVQ